MPNEPLVIAAVMVGGYLLGSTPFGVISMKLAGAGDPREIGSGNIGATNVLRSGRKDLALLTLLGDGGKGALAVLGAYLLTRGAPDATRHMMVALAAGSAFLGHLFPVFLRFKGGKGVSTFFGTLLAASFPVGAAAAATWLVTAALFRISSLAALTAAALAPIFALFVFQSPHALVTLTLFMGALIYVRHQDNLRRILKGEEPRIGGARKPADPPAGAP
ncbi:glycerol-3-phosphate 1-O-acyltransferase PlsY [Phenylobacterium sp.]|jgi:glycerol-3-phosphate acyltransferase PlsY|uniref:glycerol-3-phosphate 1-O-acyltransferase PlsY n=1 Tax=Phenylobacterium sp. TaxID=1871053 RepID=UPI0025FB241A|nr:glycerol-3-phosphate 1-O-acyltransferase PlsY [Phenylobacterium sp.]MCA3720142.1 glycerol-3-phosphate 1-O-acyltransferase PlsY [Phenylobacterium sp.]